MLIASSTTSASTEIIGILSVGAVLLIASITGFWALLKAIGAKFDQMSNKFDGAITELRVSQASIMARQDAMESFVKNLPQLLAQLITASHMGNQQNSGS